MRRAGIYDRNLKGRREVSASSFHFLFSEIVQYYSKRSSSAQDFAKALEDLGYHLGPRMLELVCFRERACKKETSIVEMLRFVYGPVWKTLFNKNADELEQNTEEEDEYMINEREPSLVSQFSQGADSPSLASFVAGIIEGLLNAANFGCRVTAHSVATDDSAKTVFLIKFAPEVLARDRARK
jgi:hypothetical protein